MATIEVTADLTPNADIAYHDEAGVAQTVTAGSVEADLTDAIAAASTSDIIIINKTGDVNWTGDVAKAITIYVSDAAIHDGKDPTTGAYMQEMDTRTNVAVTVVGLGQDGAAVSFSAGFYGGTSSTLTVINGISSRARGYQNVNSINCIGVPSSDASEVFSGCVADNCLAVNGGRGFHNCTIRDCISINATVTDFLTCTPAGDGFNASSDGTAVGTTKWTSVPTSIFADFAGGDYNWADGTTADTYVGADLSGTFAQDIENVTRSRWAIGPFDGPSGGGGGGDDAVLAAKANDDAYYYDLV